MPGTMLNQGVLEKHGVSAGHKAAQGWRLCQWHRPAPRNTPASLQKRAMAQTCASSGKQQGPKLEPRAVQRLHKELG